MQLARSLIVISCASATAACGTDVARAVNLAPSVIDAGTLADAGTPGIPDKPPPCTAPTIVGRLQRSRITTAEGIRYKRAISYFFGFPQDERLALAPWGSDGAMVAWLDTTGTRVHVTMLTQRLDRFERLTNDLSDALVDGTELSGLVAHHDGFAVLTRRPDLGDHLGGDGGPAQQATVLVRWQNGHEAFAKPLTGTASIVDVPENEKRDHPNVLPPSIATSGRLAHNGTNYGAYFTSQGAPGDRFDGVSSDKLVQVDGSGNFVASWRIGCQQSLGGRIIPEMNSFAAFCMSDGTSGSAGLNAVLGSRSTRTLDVEASWANYVGGNFGSAVKVRTGYLVAWASRGVTGQGNPWHDAHEPETMLITKELTTVGPSLWPFSANSNQEPSEDAVNVHAAPYGDKVLLVWETIKSPQYRNGTGAGNYGGTHFRFVDGVGKSASLEEVVGDAIAPNGQDDIVQFPNHDIGWAFVPEPERNFQAPVTAASVPNLPPIHDIEIVRLPYCEP